MNTFHTPPFNTQHFWSILLIGLSALTLLSCSEDSLTGSQDMQPPSTTGNLMATGEMQAQSKQMVQTLSPQEISKAFFAMVDKAAAMSAAEIDSLSEEEVLELGKPILQAFGNTVQFDKETLFKLDDLIGTVISDPTAITKAQRDQTASKIETILSRSSSSFSRRSFSAKEIRLQLKRIESSRDYGHLFDCSDYFNQQGDTVYLNPGDSFAIANIICRAGSTFVIFPGTHQGHSVQNSRNGNTWIGIAATLDGMDATEAAFKDGMDNNYMDGMTIKNYTRHGILSDGSENVSLMNLTFENIAPDYCKTSDCGQNEGAIMFTNSENIQVRFSDFTNVASGIRFKHSTGPLVVSNNEALNPGRNFFQCDNCEGAGIRINRNSMIRTAQFGDTMLEDWINLYQSEGYSHNWIQVKDNRARGHSNSDSGSFIMLGDGGGKYQEAKDNIGVNPGQVGIGASGGEHIKVTNNIMFGENWVESNVAYYSANYSGLPDYTCNDHIFPGPDISTPNKANWTNSNGQLERAHATGNGQCGITNAAIQDSIIYDSNIKASIWNSW